jgi:LysM repeat protein
VRTTLLRSCSLLVVLLLLTACTRERETPAPTPTSATPAATAAAAEPAVTVVDPAVAATDQPDEEAAAATPEPEEEATRDTFDYTVRGGDTLADIALRFDTTVQTLRELNFLLDDNIFAGQVLSVPYVEGMTAEGAPTPTPAPFVYVVQPGDSLSSIAAKFGISSITLVEVNNIQDPNALAVGDELLIPGYVAPAAAGSTDTTGATGATGAASGAAVAAPGDEFRHVVRAGETLSGIAQQYGVAAASLAAANNIGVGDVIRIGQELVIPGLSRQAALEASAVRHTVAAGESLSAIAQQYGVTTDAIMAFNGITDPNRILVGQVLLIPPAQ